MYTLKAFVAIDGHANNNPSVTAPFGELSTLGLTYARDVTSYRQAEQPKLDIRVFTSKHNLDPAPVNSVALGLLFRVSNFVYQRAITNMSTSNSDSVLLAVETNFGGELSSLVVGDMVSDGLVWMPSYLIFNVTNPLLDTQVKVWFADQAFRDQFDEYELAISHPVDNIDALQTSISNIQALTANLDMPALLDRLEAVASPYPYTMQKAFGFDVVNPANPDEKIKLYWLVAIYGIAGDNIDAIYNRIRQEILQNSSYPESEWMDRIPDLFQTIEFTLVPFWDQYSIPNASFAAAMYSPIVKLADVESRLVPHVPNSPLAHIRAHMTVSSYLYKSISFAMVGSIDNRNETYDLRQAFPDYALIPTIAIDFNRMSPATTGLIVMLSSMFRLAETMTEVTTLPRQFSRAIRNNKLFLVGTYNQIQFYLATKQTYFN